MSRDQAKTRVNRINRRGSEAIRAAFSERKISARRADILLHMEPEAAATELALRLSRQEEIAARSKIAAQVIREHLAAGRRDLVALSTDLRSRLFAREADNLDLVLK